MSPRATAFHAARDSAAVTAELLRFAREGAVSEQFAVEPETIEQGVASLRALIAIDLPHARARHDMVDALEQLDAALARFLVDWG